ncbi:hypothetical protein ES708_05173 [subsurface metagenome]
MEDMKALDKSLRDRVTKAKGKSKEAQARRYQFAKQLGFTAVEAAILQNWSEERIRLLAEHRKSIQ